MAGGIQQEVGLWSSIFEKESLQPRLPLVDSTKYLVNGEIREWKGKSVNVYAPIYDKEGKQIQLGTYAFLDEQVASEAVNAAANAYGKGRGVWPTTTMKERIKHIQRFADGLKSVRDRIVDILMWEICKNKGDAQKEVDRTIKYILDTIAEVKQLENHQNAFISDSGIVAQVKRVPLGVVLCAGPFNYPLNETYTTMIPALLMGNTVILKTPRTGCLCHVPTLELFKEIFPPGVVNVIHGSGRDLMPPIMKTGLIDIFAFIGTSKAASELQKAHPSPHKLRTVLGLDAKNPAIILPDADLDVAVSECVLGSLSFNGQRCTAIKIIFVHESIADTFVPKLSAAIDALPIGLPWVNGTLITPLPEPNKPEFLLELIRDALSKGAKIANARGGKVDRSIFAPTVLYPVLPGMRVHAEEQFGPIVPVVSYSSLNEVYSFIVDTSYGQQAAIFSTSPNSIPELIDVLASQVSRINVNCQCQRGPDSFPFTGRKNSAYGTLSVFDALRTMSIRAVVATKENDSNVRMLEDIMLKRSSNFVRAEYLF
eukprot:TRINITY_DN1899_c0_g1_i1.p1 TRINITY_DN1899_c0_g1~~TRINITY_DN1899_c0_g1_i1.p1  ORF type:complete len:540 (+),score=91.52 TRINITY_DN1899_c0_g1_i1:165-1784(+)